MAHPQLHAEGERAGQRLRDAAGVLPTPSSYPIAKVSRVHILGSQARGV